jgi:hypothetical protein
MAPCSMTAQYEDLDSILAMAWQLLKEGVHSAGSAYHIINVFDFTLTLDPTRQAKSGWVDVSLSICTPKTQRYSFACYVALKCITTTP